MKSATIGIDIGGTNLRFALVDSSGTILERCRTGSGIEEGREVFCDRILTGISGLRRAAETLGFDAKAVGIGAPGLIGLEGLIKSSINMRPLDGFNIADFLEKRTGLPVACGNDANVIALGEQRFGAGMGLSSFMVVTIGTGLGSGLILEGKLWTGVNGYASEFGHVTVQQDGLPCPCGNRGCLEQYVSAGAVVRYARELIAPDILANTVNDLDAETVAALARAGVPGALAAFDRLGCQLGVALASLANTLNLQAVVIGGGVSASFDLMLPAIQGEMSQRCFPQILEGFEILKTNLGDDAGLLGGAALAEARVTV